MLPPGEIEENNIMLGNVFKKSLPQKTLLFNENELRYEISNNVVCETSKASDQPAHTRSLIRAFASLLNIL